MITRMLVAVILHTCLFATIGLAGAPFSISVVQKQLVERAGGTVFDVVARADTQFKANIFMRVSSPTLPPSVFKLSNPTFDHPYSGTIQLTVQTSGANATGDHVIVIEGYNGPSVSTDTCILTIPSRDGWTVYTTENSGLPSDTVYTIQLDKQGVAWIGTHKGLARFDGDSWLTYNVGSVFLVALQHGSVPWVLRDGRLWRMVGNEFHKFESTEFKANVDRMCAGSDGSIWAYSVSANQVARISDTGVAVYDMGDFISSNPWASITAMLVDRDSALWLGFSGYNKYWIVKFDGTYWSVFQRSQFQIAEFQATEAFVEDTLSGVWSVSQEGLVHIRNDGSTSYPRSTSGAFPGFRPTALAIDSLYKDRWVGVTRDGNNMGQPVGIARYTEQGRTLYQASNTPLPESRINDLQADANGKLWAATYSGLVLVDVLSVSGTVSVTEATGYSSSESGPIVEVSPNPSIDKSSIHISGLTPGEEISVVLRDITGRIAHTLHTGTASNSSMTLTLPSFSLPNGFNMLHVYCRNVFVARPVVIQR